MKNLKANYVEKVLRLFLNSRYSRRTEIRVSRWLVNGKDSELKNGVLNTIWDETLAEEQPDGREIEQAYARWQESVARRSQSETAVPCTSAKAIRPRILRFWQALAACLVLAVGALSWVALTKRTDRSPMMQVYCSAGKTKAVALPDGSVVTLNGASSVTYPLNFAGESRREVLLLGEACFKVARNPEQPFVVKSGNVDVTALGTRFNVKAYPEHSTVSTTLLEGKVSVDVAGSADPYILNPSDQLTFYRSTGAVEISTAELSDVTAWQRGEIVFNNMTLAEILSELGTRFSHDFVYNPASLPADRFTFRFRKGMTLEEVMQIVGDVAGNISVSVSDTTCKVRRKA